MGNLKGKDLKKINYRSNEQISMAKGVMAQHYKYLQKEKKIELLCDVRDNYEQYLDHEHWAGVASGFETNILVQNETIELLPQALDYAVFGSELISSNARQQMNLAMRLPISRAGAMMPDAHMGYGLPIGGVLATENAVIPYGVGLDIGCRMSLTLYDLNHRHFVKHQYKFKMALKERTCFGLGGEIGVPQEHTILEDERFKMTDLTRKLKGKAVKQLGSSGSGNHFVEFGLVDLEANNGLGLEKGSYIGLMAHSGSRGFGAAVAGHYTRVAKETTFLPKTAGHLAWLGLDTEAGLEYWESMQLAGDYAKACHDQIHYNIQKYLGIQPLCVIENHHNFAWKEKQKNGQEWVVHRKGATPAGKGAMGIIPGNMIQAGKIVKGLGNEQSLQSASHGAGRKSSRKAMKESLTKSAMTKQLKQAKVTLLGGAVDEAPQAYKDLNKVMECQTNLVETIGSFEPLMVRMDKK